MTVPNDCAQNRDTFKLVREGTSQDQRFPKALDPDSVPVNERTPAHGMVFAQAYAAYLKYFDSNNVATGDWKPFFSEDVAVLLAMAAVADVEYYRQKIREFIDFLNDRKNRNDVSGLRDNLDYLFSCCASLTIGLNHLTEKLPVEIRLKKSLQNLVQNQLHAALKRLIAYYKGGMSIDDLNKPVNDSSDEKTAPFDILGRSAVKFSELEAASLSKDWTGGVDWKTYYGDIEEEISVYGNFSNPDVFDRVNHIATHNLFTSILDQFLKVFARSTSDAKTQLEEDVFKKWDRHEPHYALFLAFLRLFEYARTEANTLSGRHLDLYYREILRLREKPAESGKSHLLVELAKQASSHLFAPGELFKAGKDDLGNEAYFANNRDFVANRAKVAALKTVYRHDTGGPEIPPGDHTGRFFASPLANSDDGQGAELASVDKSWHPFHNKVYKQGKLHEIKMPEAEIGFALASHYLLMAEGTRTVTLDIFIDAPADIALNNLKDDVVCLITTEKDWLKLDTPVSDCETLESGICDFEKMAKSDILRLIIKISGAEPAITPYVSKVHGYTFDTRLPILILKLKHSSKTYIYSQLENITIKGMDLTVKVDGLRTLAVSNDFGPIDTSKPFQPFGPSPIKNNALIVGSKEVFQKALKHASVNVEWLAEPAPYKTFPLVNIDFLEQGRWRPSDISPLDVGSVLYESKKNLEYPVMDEPDFDADEFYNTEARHGFVRLKLTDDFGQPEYQENLLKYLRKETDSEEPDSPPVGPTMNGLWMNYCASQTIDLNSAEADDFSVRQARFFHFVPFGQTEQHPFLNSADEVFLLPQFAFQNKDGKKSSEAEFYIGITDLKPPQNLALLFQVVDGSADPLVVAPAIHWSYLSNNEWIPFKDNEVDDQTGGLLDSGIITFAMPRAASATNTLLPAKMYWIRAAVATASDAVCRLITVAAQVLQATFTNKGNDPAFPAKVLQSGTITKLDQPNAAVKKITQPFATFGGRGKESSRAFYTRVSERLRHKDRAITLWDYERLVLAAFPQIYRAKCLNHTHYERSANGSGTYRELAPGHVTVVTIPKQQSQNRRNPLRPFTSLGLLKEIEFFLLKRLSCFVKLHVENPQFEEVRVNCCVRLNPGLDEVFYEKKLQEAIVRFLSPWAFSAKGNPSFGGKIYKSVLIDFMEELPYVDYMADFKLFHEFDDINDGKQSVEKNEVEGSKAVSLLVSAPADRHKIEIIKFDEEKTLGETCPCEP